MMLMCPLPLPPRLLGRLPQRLSRTALLSPAQQLPQTLRLAHLLRWHSPLLSGKRVVRPALPCLWC